jgi:hypothetical protein
MRPKVDSALDAWLGLPLYRDGDGRDYLVSYGRGGDLGSRFCPSNYGGHAPPARGDRRLSRQRTRSVPCGEYAARCESLVTPRPPAIAYATPTTPLPMCLPGDAPITKRPASDRWWAGWLVSSSSAFYTRAPTEPPTPAISARLSLLASSPGSASRQMPLRVGEAASGGSSHSWKIYGFS